MVCVVQKLAQAELAGDAAEQRAGFEVDRLWRGKCLAAGIAVEPGNTVSGVGLGVAADGVVVEDAKYLGHFRVPFYSSVERNRLHGRRGLIVTIY